MIESTSTRHNPLVDPHPSVWSWEIPVDLFFAAVVAGMMILSGIALLHSRRGTATVLRVHAPLAAFGLVHICLVALFLDLSHKLFVWNLYLTLQPRAPMSWGSWLLSFVYVVLAVTALAGVPSHWPWLARRVPVLAPIAGALSSAKRLRVLAWLNVVLGLALALYTGVLLATMVARPLWNTMALPPLFLASGLASAAAVLALASRFVAIRSAPPPGAMAGLVNALVVAVPGQNRAAGDADGFTRLAVAFLAAQAIALLLFVIGLASGNGSQIEALGLLLDGPFATPFWMLVVVLGLVVPLLLLAAGRKPAPVVAGLGLLLAGGLALRWVLVDAGQVSRLLPGVGP